MFSQKKPFSAVTVTIENLTSETYEEEDLSGIPDLVEVIKLQASGPAEAARAIRKKLKYGSVHRQLRALVLLDGLIQNAGPRFQRAFADEPLLERLRVCGTSDLSHPEVKKKCNELFRGWSQYKSTPGMDRIARLYKELPKKKVTVTQERSKVLRETEENPFGDDEDEEAKPPAAAAAPRQGESSSSSSSQIPYGRTSGTVQSFSSHSKKPSGSGSSFFSSSRDKKKDSKKSGGGKRRTFNLEAEKETMKGTIADSSIATTNLMNAMQSINRERERISDNMVAVERFETCKQLRRRILRYIHHVSDEQWLGSLLKANDELVVALMTFEQLDRSIDADSDSEDELAEQAHLYRMATLKGKEPSSPTSPTSPPVEGVLGLSIAPSPPPRPSVPPRPSDESKPSAPPVPVRKAQPAPAPVSDDEDEDEDENDPFGDSHAVATPQVERSEWVSGH